MALPHRGIAILCCWRFKRLTDVVITEETLASSVMKAIRRACLCDDCFDLRWCGLHHGRRAVLNAAHAEQVCPGENGMFAATIVIDGHVVATWKRVFKKTGIDITATPFTHLSPADTQRFATAVQRYGSFHMLPVQSLMPEGSYFGSSTKPCCGKKCHRTFTVRQHTVDLTFRKLFP